MSEDMNKVKQVELEILCEFMKVCNQLGVRWYAGCGTVLGAIRHGGFIPWDDDIDVLMPRKDYEIFCEKAQGLVGEQYFVQTLTTDAEYCQPFAKLRRSDTTFLEIESAKDNINHGIYIDIFPLDGYPTNRVTEKVFMIKRIIYNNFIYQNGELNQLDGYRKLFAMVYRLFRGKLTRKEAAVKKEKMVKRIPFDEAVLVSCLIGDIPKKQAISPSTYGNGREVPFENLTIKVPAKCEFYLEKLYGNYMQLPPEADRVSLHQCLVIDTEKSYLEYQDKKQ